MRHHLVGNLIAFQDVLKYQMIRTKPQLFWPQGDRRIVQLAQRREGRVEFNLCLPSRTTRQTADVDQLNRRLEIQPFPYNRYNPARETINVLTVGYRFDLNR